MAKCIKDQIETKLEETLKELNTFKLQGDPELKAFLLGQKDAFMDTLRLLQ